MSISWSLFSSTFALIFLAELPDKTIFAVLLLAASHRPAAIFVGAALAFLIQTMIALLFGSALTLVPAEVIRYGSALLFFIFAVQIWRKHDEAAAEAVVGAGAKPSPSERFWPTLWLSFVTIFVAEWGDLSQLATAALVAKFGNLWTVGLAATLALWAAAGLGAMLGRVGRGYLDAQLVHRLGAVAMAGAGIYSLVKS